jgi:hypothetical protein
VCVVGYIVLKSFVVTHRIHNSMTITCTSDVFSHFTRCTVHIYITSFEPIGYEAHLKINQGTHGNLVQGAENKLQKRK